MKRTILLALAVTFAIASLARAQGTYRNQRLFVVPAPKGVAVDGDLDDWDLSGEIYTFVSEATAEFQSARTAAMYDADAFYLASRIADPSPMMNRNDPAVNPDFGWDADAFQFRICLDPKMGYPINIGYGQGEMASDNIVHMTLWYFTDAKRPVLHLKYGMNYHDAPDYPKGIVPRDRFKAAFKAWPDGKGFTLEYRIPWSALRQGKAGAPLKAGDLTASAIQIQWSDPEGKHSYGGGWGVDLLRQAGFSYQSTGCWGKLIFTELGNLPKELTQEGLPPVRQLPLKLTFDMPKQAEVSIVLIDEKGDRVRNIIASQVRPRGTVTESWDGLDDAGRVLPSGSYTWKGLHHDKFEAKYVLSAGNSGTPGYHTPDGKGAWGGDWDNPKDVCFAGDRGLIAWGVAEAGPGIIMIDAKDRKQWGGRFGASYLATDGEWLFASLTHEKQIRAYNVADGKQLNFLRGEMWAEHNAGNETACTGLAFAGGKLYVADAKSNTVTEYQGREGKIIRRINAPGVTWLAAFDANTLLAVSGGTVRKLSLADGKLAPFIADHLDQPAAVAAGPDGTVYVSNHGRLMNVSVFDKAGKYQRSIGKTGGRALPPELFPKEGNASGGRRGKWDPDAMLNPRGLAVDSRGRLWICEDDFQPKRITIWEAASGKLLDEKFGACYVSTPVTMDPADPTRVYTQNVEWEVDLDKGTWKPAAIMIDARPDSGYFWPHMVNNIVFIATNGKQYMHAGNTLYIRRGDHFEAVAGVFGPRSGFTWRPGAKTWEEANKMPYLLWEDRNGDGIIQKDETRETKMCPQQPHGCFAPDLTMYAAGMYGALYWQRISPKQILDNGVPIYDDASFFHVDYVTREEAKVPTYTHDIAVNPADGSVLMYAGADIKFMDKAEIWPLTCWSKDGKLLWRYRKGSRWYDAYEFPIPQPGELWGTTKCIGITPLPGNGGGITGFSSYHGMVHLLTSDGIIIGTLMKDGRSGETGPDQIQCEWFTGQLVKAKNGKWYLTAGDQDGRVLEITGLDTITRFDGKLTITEQDAKAAADALAEWSALKAKAQSLVISRTQGTPDWMNIRGITVALDAHRGFTAKAAYTADSLIINCKVDAPFELTNSIQETQMLFKGGNAIDLQLATDPKADPKRDKPAPGDVRVLITRRAGKPIAVVYRHKVAGFQGQPTVFTSPTGQESIDQIEVWDDIALTCEKTEIGFTAVATVPLAKLGWKPVPGTTVKMDVGYLFGNQTGNATSVRAYWTNHSFASGVTADVPHESRIEPNQWGLATVE